MAGAFETVREVTRDSRPLVLHVIHRFATGGLENGLVNLINHMPSAACRHAVLAMTEITDFSERLKRDDVGLLAMHKSPGHGVKLYPRLVPLLRVLQPAVMHTRNLGALEMQPAAALAGVHLRVHGEHGRELNDLDGNNRRLQWTRRVYAPFVHRFVALSCDLGRYLVDRVGVASAQVSQIYNGVDGARFRPGAEGPEGVPGCPFDLDRHWLVGTVGRMQGVKNQTLLARAFVQAATQSPALRARGRLVLVGDGPLRAECEVILAQAGLRDSAWLPGELNDVPEVLRGLSCFVLPSLAEGISNTILEAMATALPVIATAVGGNGELIVDGSTGLLVPPNDPGAMAAAILALYGDPIRAQGMGRAGRQEVDQRYSMEAMVASYLKVYAPGLGIAQTGR